MGNGYSSFNDVDIKNTIEDNSDVLAFIDMFGGRINDFKDSLVSTLIRDNYDINAKTVLDTIVDKLFETVSDLEVIDKYDAYQVLMENWDTIETDMSIIGTDKNICRNIEPNYVIKKAKKNGEENETEEQKGFKGTIMPFDIVGKKYFGGEYSKLEALESTVSSLESEIADIHERLDDEIKDVTGSSDKFKEAELKKYIKNDADDSIKDELQTALDDIMELKAKRKEIKKIETVLLVKIMDKIKNLTDDEIDELLIIKWIEPLCGALMGISKQMINAFIKSISDMKDRYYKPMSVIDGEIDNISEEICAMIDKLVGNDIDMAALQALKADL